MSDDATPPDDDAPRPSPANGGDRVRFAARDIDFDGANDEARAIRLAALEEEHRDLDAAIRALEAQSPHERLTVARLKKKKLQLRDRIQEIKDAMLPDIIA